MFYLNLFLGFVLGVGFTGLLVAYIGVFTFPRNKRKETVKELFLTAERARERSLNSVQASTKLLFGQSPDAENGDISAEMVLIVDAAGRGNYSITRHIVRPKQKENFEKLGFTVTYRENKIGDPNNELLVALHSVMPEGLYTISWDDSPPWKKDSKAYYEKFGAINAQ